MNRGSLDDGPKLREEKHFQDFYPDLNADTLLPFIVPLVDTKDNSTDTDSDDISNRNNREIGSVKSVQTKELIFKGRVTTEPLVLKKNEVEFQKCKITTNELKGKKNPYCVRFNAVSYTHLDVYKRQIQGSSKSLMRLVQVTLHICWDDANRCSTCSLRVSINLQIRPTIKLRPDSLIFYRQNRQKQLN